MFLVLLNGILMVTTTNKMAAADFFPPNPEDGELWLPSFIIREISTINAAVLPYHQITTTFEICFGSFDAKQIIITTNSNPAATVTTTTNNNNNKHKLAPPPITAFPQGIVEGEKRTNLPEKYGGTGVFLPRLTNIVAGAAAGGEKTEETSRGTGFFHNHQVSVTCQKKEKSKVPKRRTLWEVINNKLNCRAINNEDILGKQKNSQNPSGRCLPND